METMALSTQSKDQIYDLIRNKWVLKTPEELVRQALLKKMIGELFYPKELIAVEKGLSEISFEPSAPPRRIDVVCFAKNIHPSRSLYPLLLIECKESKKDALKALEQVKGYNLAVKAYFIAVAYPEGELFGFLEQGHFKLLDYLPPYSQLIASIYGH